VVELPHADDTTIGVLGDDKKALVEGAVPLLVVASEGLNSPAKFGIDETGDLDQAGVIGVSEGSDVDGAARAAGWFALGAVPLWVLGGVVFAATPAPFLARFLSVFLLGAVVYRHTRHGKALRLPLRGFAGLGAVFGFLSALVGTVGPLAAPFFLTYGLTRGAYIGTEAATALVMHAVKLSGYGRYALLDITALINGLAIGVVMIVGSYAGKRLIDWLPASAFSRLVEIVLIVSGLQLLLAP